MPVDGKDTTRIEDGVEKPMYTVEFTNGALDQLKELSVFLKTESLLDVVKLGISVIESAKQRQSQADTEKGDGK